jgi:CRISPR-associated protein Cas5t
VTPFWLRVRAPFAAFRWLQAGVYRASSPTMPPSAAWGLVLNLAGIETRSEVPAPVTLRRSDAPRCDIAVGERRTPELASIYQQLHGYPVGESGKARAAQAHGSKYWIAPARREVLVEVDLIIGIRNESVPLASRIRAGLRGELPRYGLPFLGDNNFLVDRVEVLESPSEAFWYCRVPEQASETMRETCRLTVDIDREDGSRTVSGLYRRSSKLRDSPPEEAWTRVPCDSMAVSKT